MGFLADPASSPEQQGMYDEDLEEDGFVWDLTRQWAHHPSLLDGLMDLTVAAAEAAGLSMRERAMLVLGQAATREDSYCSVAWARKLTNWADADIALTVLTAATASAATTDEVDAASTALTQRERALLGWARRVAADPNAIHEDDLAPLRRAGFDEAQILALTAFTALRIAVSTTNDALGATPDRALVDSLHPDLQSLISWGRQPS